MTKLIIVFFFWKIIVDFTQIIIYKNNKLKNYISIYIIYCSPSIKWSCKKIIIILNIIGHAKWPFLIFCFKFWGMIVLEERSSKYE